MEPDQQLATEQNDQAKLQTTDEQKKENEESEVTSAKIEPVAVELVMPEALKSVEISMKSSEKSPETFQPEKEASKTEKEGENLKEDKKVEDKKSSEVKNPSEDEKPIVESENKEKSCKTEAEIVNKPEETSEKSNLPSFPGIVKPVPGSNDVKIEIDSNSLLDHVILFSLKNTVVDNSRLDAAKNKYMLNKGNITASFSSNSNGSDSNSSSKSVEKLIEEFKGGCSKPSDEISPANAAAAMEQKSDISNETTSNGAEICGDSSRKDGENDQNVISSSQGAGRNLMDSMPLKDVQGEAAKSADSPKLHEPSPPRNLENEALDFRDNSKESSPTMLDLTIPHRDEKSVPMIKRNHALYVGLPDFSKQIFTEPSISRPANPNQAMPVGPPKIKNPDFSVAPRVQPELQMRKPDFSKSFDAASTTTIPVTPSNFPEIIRKNNYISDLQLKTPTHNQPSNSSNTSSSYKIDYRSSPAISHEAKSEQPSTSQTVYPNMKKESINAYNQQQLNIDEPMAHIIHKNQFMPHANEATRVGWNDRGERLLGGSSTSVQRPRNHSESEVKPQIHEQYQNSSEDLRKNHPAHYVHPYLEREFNNNSIESIQLSAHEFSLKQKEQQLRQEGTTITIKNESTKTPTREIVERRSADLFRDYKLKQPKESPDSVRRAAEHLPPMGYQQAYPDFPMNYPKHGQPPKAETIVKPVLTSVPPLAYPHDRQMNQMPTSSRSYHSPSPVSYQHHQPKSPLTVPPGPSLMNPPQNWPPPPPLVMQQPVQRHAASPGGPSPSPNNYQHHASQSPHMNMNYGYSYPHQAPQGPTAVKVNPNYPPYGQRHGEVKEIPNRNYQPSSSSAPNNYYHQKYPDFGRHFDPEKSPQVPYDARHAQNYPSNDGINYQRLPHHELEMRVVREQPPYRMEPGPPYYPKPHENEPVPMQNYPPRVQEQVRHSEPAIRIHDDERLRGALPMKVERRIDEPPKIVAGPSNLNLRRPEPTEVSVIAKVKIEPAQPARNVPSTSTLVKSAKSTFAEVKRESPLDLSVKTVKTKADSTGCDQDMMSRHRAEPSGLKVEFTPNFGKVAKTDCRQQARIGPQEFPQSSRPSQNVPERPSGSQRYPSEEATRTPPTQSHLQIPPHGNSRGYYQDQRYQQVREMERPRAPAAPFPSSSQFPEQMNYPPDQKPMEHPRPSAQPTLSQRPEDNRRSNAYYMPPQQPAVAAAPYPVPPKPVHHSPADTSRPMNPRDPLYYERERDRKNVENLLYGRHRKEAAPTQPEMRHFQPISSPPRKRVIENQQSVIPPKQVRVEEPPRSMVPRHIPPQHYQHLEQQRYQKIENHAKSLQAMGQPPLLLKNESYPRPHLQHDTKYYPDSRKDMPAVPPTHPQYQNNQYYPNPKAEMIHRSDPSYKQEKIQFPNQNFQQRPDDSTLQYQRIHHPVQQESGIKNEHQSAGPLPGTSGEPARMINGMIPASVSGSNGNIARGADQSTIMKLKNNLELKKLTKTEIGDEDQKNDLSPRQFRSKGSMKAFVPLPTNFAAKHVATTSPALPSTGSSAFDLLDWGSACNDFVQQLETGKKRPKKKRSMAVKGNQEEKSTSGIPGTTSNNLSEIPKEIIMNSKKNSSSDEDKPLLELVNSDAKVHSSVVEKISEKISRNMREKQRLELEQKMSARLGKPSSSESETDTRRPMRPAKRVRRLRKRAALGIKKTDEELSVEEEETEDEVTCKRRSSKSVLKLEDLTSSEDDGKKNSKDPKSGDDKKLTKAVKKVVTKDSKKQETSSGSSDSDEPTEEKLSKLSSSKKVKQLKDLCDVSSIKNLLEEGETMTRSKRKLENEKNLSNSKILRNEKVVRNVSPDKKAKTETTPTSGKKMTPKRKDSARSEDAKRKVESDSDTAGKSKKKLRRVSSKLESSSEESQVEEDNKAERLRPRKIKPEIETPPKASKDAKKKLDEKLPTTKPVEENAPEGEPKQTLPCRIPFTGMFPFKDDKTSKFAPGWEADTYSFKRSLKIPAGLITIGRPPLHGISHSLPDLDPQTSDTSEIFSEFVKSKDKEGVKDAKVKAETSKAQKPQKKPNSIIDVLHQRVIQSKKKFKAKKASNIAGGTPVQPNDDDLLPTPEKESEKIFGIRKNIFETSIITSRTRTENNALRKKEILKEVFGADDERPKSAPPVGAPKPEDSPQEVIPEPEHKISYDQKYREYLEKMNVDFLTKPDECKTADTSVKDDDEDDDDNETVVASEMDLVTPTLKGKVKKGRVRRCKGSSGFDYIRKKKKPTPNASENPLSVNNIIKKRLAAMENLENKDENDISKEIKGWVLNKGVGESVLHKASRLDYVDVIAYCLDRLNMSPDQKDNAGYTPLHEACSRGHLEIARILLQYGANHSETALSGIRPLHEAIENGHVEIVRLLISYGADPCLATYSGQMPVAMAEDQEMEDFLREYLNDINDKVEKRASWYFDGPFKIEDPSEEGYEVFNDIPIVKTDLGSSVASVFSTSLTSLVTATTQMSDNETNASESTATPIKVPSTPMKAPSQDLIKYQHKMKKCDTNSNNLVMNSLEVNSQDNSKMKKTKSCSVVLKNIDLAMKKIKKLPAIPKQEQMQKLSEPIQKLEEIKHKEDYDDMVDGDNLESDNEFLELEESDAPLPPLYLLRDEGSDKWILLTDLCNLLKVKSKDAVLKQICPLSPPSVNKELIRELKMSDFLEKAICLQLFCAGEKLNVRASKVSLVRYNDSVRNLLGVQTIRMNM